MLKVTLDRFNAAIEKQGDDGCWLWTKRSTTSYGYGQLWEGRKRWEAHRLSWTIHRGPIPAGMCVCHRCDVPQCVNPDHLFLGNQRDNLRDMLLKGRAHEGYRKEPPNGVMNHKAKLTDDDIREIRRRYMSGESLRQLGRAYNVWFTTIHQIVLRKTWPHVT
jgi:hypothetical protein